MRACSSCGARFSNDVRFCPQDGQPLEELTQVEVVDPLLGVVIDGRYRIEQVLGEGGMGIVYLATHTALNKRMALKVLRGEMARDESIIQRFIQEAQASSSIGHANIINISDFGRMDDGSAYFVMELLEGVSLTERIRQTGRLESRLAVHITTQIASALAAAHSRGIVHRDLKPDNVQLVPRGNDTNFVKVLDFGIAKVGGSNSKLTKTGMVFGTPHYMSPEQAAGQSVDNRADIYALGVILFEMLTGSVPFDGDTFMGILSKHMFEPPPRPSDIAGSDLGPLEPIVLRSLCKKPEDRYQTMEEIISDLETIAQGGVVSFQVPSSVAPPPQLAGSYLSPSSVSESAPPKLPSSRTPILVIGVIAGLLGLGALAGAIAAMVAEPDSTQAQVETPPAPTLPPATAIPPPAASPPPSPMGEPVATADEPSEPSSTAEPVEQLIRLVTEPPGATVSIDGVVLGNTPLPVPRPAEGESQLVRLEMSGYSPREVTISSRNGETVQLALSRTRPRTTTRRRPRPTPSPVMVPMDMAAMVPIHSEVVDPWEVE